MVKVGHAGIANSFANCSNAPSMSRLLNAEYACSIWALVAVTHPPTLLVVHSVLVFRTVHIIPDQPQRKEGGNDTLFISVL
jgi:hypothetical protein